MSSAEHYSNKGSHFERSLHRDQTKEKSTGCGGDCFLCGDVKRCPAVNYEKALTSVEAGDPVMADCPMPPEELNI